MSKVAIEIPDEALVALKVDAAGAGAELRLVAAIKLYELGRLSSGGAARLAGIPRIAFLTRLRDFGVATFTQTDEELAKDMRNA